MLVLRRSPDTRCAGSWETVHGHIDDGEKPVDAALRELREETGLEAQQLYHLSRVDSFYLHRTDTIALIPVFCAVVSGEPVLSAEHDRFEWLALDEAMQKCAWPREKRALADAEQLLRGGGAGLLEDVLRVR